MVHTAKSAATTTADHYQINKDVTLKHKRSADTTAAAAGCSLSSLVLVANYRGSIHDESTNILAGAVQAAEKPSISRMKPSTE